MVKPSRSEGDKIRSDECREMAKVGQRQQIKGLESHNIKTTQRTYISRTKAKSKLSVSYALSPIIFFQGYHSANSLR